MAFSRKNNYNNEDNTLPKPKLNSENFKQLVSLYSYILPHKKWFIIGIFFLIASTATSLAFPYFTGKLIDAAQKHINFSINQIALCLLGILLLQGFFSFMRVWLFAKVAENSLADLRKDLYNKIMWLPITFFEQHRVGDITNRLSADVGLLHDTFSITLAEFVRQIATLLVGVTIILFISPKLTLLMICTFPVAIVGAIIFGKRIRLLAKQTQDALGNTNVIAEETLQAIQVVKTFTNEQYENNRYGIAINQVLNTALKAATARSFFISFIISVLFGGIVLVLWYGAYLIEQQEMTTGNLTSFVIYTAFIGGAVGGMGDLYSQLQRTIGASERLRNILQQKTEVPENEQVTINNAPKLKGEVLFKNINFNYPSRPDMPVIKNLNFEIKAGQKIALVGASGAGKSTIAQLIMQLYTPLQGTIFFDKKPATEYPLTHLRQNIGVVPQDVMLFGGTIYENIAYGNPQATPQQIQDAAMQANALQFINSFTEGMQTIVGERGIKLSGGQKQRIAIARAILKNPAILILDEATSALDAESEMQVQQALDNLMQNRTTLIIAHRLSTIKNADLICVLNQGEITEKGTHQELIQHQNGIYHSLLKLQLGNPIQSHTAFEPTIL